LNLYAGGAASVSGQGDYVRLAALGDALAHSLVEQPDGFGLGVANEVGGVAWLTVEGPDGDVVGAAH